MVYMDGSTGNDVLSSEDTEERAFARAICANQKNSAAALDAHGDIAKHGRQLVFVDLSQAFRISRSDAELVQNAGVGRGGGHLVGEVEAAASEG